MTTEAAVAVKVALAVGLLGLGWYMLAEQYDELWARWRDRQRRDDDLWRHKRRAWALREGDGITPVKKAR